MRNPTDRRRHLRAAIRAIREFERQEGVTAINRSRVNLPNGARSIVSTTADGRRYACGYM